MMRSKLHTMFTESPGRRIDRSHVMEMLGTDSKSITTRTVKSAFPTVELDKRSGEYKNLRRSISFHTGDEGLGIQVIDNTEISNLQKHLLMHKKKAEVLFNDLAANCSVDDNIYLRTLINMYNDEMKNVSTLQESIDHIYEREMKLLLGRKSEAKLPTSTRETIVEEFHNLSSILDIGIRSGDKQSDEVITLDTINIIRTEFKRECPVLADIVISLFPEPVDSNRKANCAVHALSLLTSVRNQSISNDITMVFTLLLVSYGAGCRMINTL